METKKRWVIMVLLATCVVGMAAKQADKQSKLDMLKAFLRPVEQRETLAELKGVQVLVETLPGVAEECGLTAPGIQRDGELVLRDAGIKVYSEEQSANEARNPGFYVRVNVVKGRSVSKELQDYLYAVQVHFKQRVILSTDPPKFIPATTWWGTSHVGVVAQDELGSSVQEAVKDKLNEFINDFHTANPESGRKK
jgi:hypothetical protein